MRKTITRPGHTLPNWSAGYLIDVDDMAHVVADQEALCAVHERERQAGDRMARLGFGLLIASLFSGLVWAALIAGAFETASELHEISAPLAAVSHVL